MLTYCSTFGEVGSTFINMANLGNPIQIQNTAFELGEATLALFKMPGNGKIVC
jgi:hypothetical protein